MPEGNPHYLLPRYLKATGDNCEKLYAILDANRRLFNEARGSQHNHHAWPGGYLQHLVNTIAIAQQIYHMNWVVPFTWSSVVLVLFLNDIEKPFMQHRMAEDPNMLLWTKLQRVHFRSELIVSYDIALTPEETIALAFVEGEGAFYSPNHRAMNELGALCHAADILSARLWHSRGKPIGEQ